MFWSALGFFHELGPFLTKIDMSVSKNNGTPKSSILIGFSIINHPFWGFFPLFLERSISLNTSWSTQWPLTSFLQVISKELKFPGKTAFDLAKEPIDTNELWTFTSFVQWGNASKCDLLISIVNLGVHFDGCVVFSCCFKVSHWCSLI